MIHWERLNLIQWKWGNDYSLFKLYLRHDICCSDGVPITDDDIIYTFDVCSDPKVDIRYYGQLKVFYTNNDLQFDI